MADEQGLDAGENRLADGEFARGKTGRIVKALLANVGPDGRGFTARASPPDNPELGDVYLSDGADWDPNAAGSPELVIYDSSDGWTSIAVL